MSATLHIVTIREHLAFAQLVCVRGSTSCSSSLCMHMCFCKIETAWHRCWLQAGMITLVVFPEPCLATLSLLHDMPQAPVLRLAAWQVETARQFYSKQAASAIAVGRWSCDARTFGLAQGLVRTHPNTCAAFRSIWLFCSAGSCHFVPNRGFCSLVDVTARTFEGSMTVCCASCYAFKKPRLISTTGLLCCTSRNVP